MNPRSAESVVCDRLQELLGIELRIARELPRLSAAAAGDTDSECLINRVRGQAQAHAQGIEARLAVLGAAPQAAVWPGPTTTVDSPADALRAAFALLSEAVVGYAAIIPACNRVRDSPITASEGTTAHLARAYCQEYLAAMGSIGGAVQATVLRELAALGYECRCTCPACGVGLCACGIGARAILSEAWLASRPEAGDADLTIPRPRSTSAAASAGFREGDRLLTVDGIEITSYPQLQTTIKSHHMGDSLRFTARRAGKEHHIALRRAADIGDGDLPLDCEAPSGAVFYLDRARDLQQRLQRRSRRPSGKSSGLGALSVRETQVLRLLTDGATNPMIASKLRISRPTVARHIANILSKLDVSNRSEAAAIAAANGLKSDV